MRISSANDNRCSISRAEVLNSSAASRSRAVGIVHRSDNCARMRSNPIFRSKCFIVSITDNSFAETADSICLPVSTNRGGLFLPLWLLGGQLWPSSFRGCVRKPRDGRNGPGIASYQPIIPRDFRPHRSPIRRAQGRSSSGPSCRRRGRCWPRVPKARRLPCRVVRSAARRSAGPRTGSDWPMTTVDPLAVFAEHCGEFRKVLDRLLQVGLL